MTDPYQGPVLTVKQKEQIRGVSTILRALEIIEPALGVAVVTLETARRQDRSRREIMRSAKSIRIVRNGLEKQPSPDAWALADALGELIVQLLLI